MFRQKWNTLTSPHTFRNLSLWNASFYKKLDKWNKIFLSLRQESILFLEIYCCECFLFREIFYPGMFRKHLWKRMEILPLNPKIKSHFELRIFPRTESVRLLICLNYLIHFEMYLLEYITLYLCSILLFLYCIV